MPGSFISVENGIESPVNNKKELSQLIQILFRTDFRQEQTNDRTKDDWAVFPLFDEESLIFEDEDNRRGLAGIAEDTVTVILAGENTELTDDMLPDRLFSFSLIKTDDKGNPVSEPFTTDDRDFIISQFLLSEYADLLTLVCHRDEKDGFERLCGIFVWLPGRLNRIVSVLDPDLLSEITSGGEESESDSEEDADDVSEEGSDDADSDSENDSESAKREE